MKIRPLWIVLGIGALLAIWLVTGYNGLVTSKAGVDNAWAQVETQYQRRFDLVPNLVNTVKGAANFEQSTLTAITQARSSWQSAKSTTDKISAAQSLDGSLARLIVTVESYPTLQATQAYRDLMTQLEGTENRIAVARRDFNDAVMTYNVGVQRFPGNLVALIFGFKAESSFQAAEGSDKAPTVNFGE